MVICPPKAAMNMPVLPWWRRALGALLLGRGPAARCGTHGL